jgi:hypothetical protein
MCDENLIFLLIKAGAFLLRRVGALFNPYKKAIARVGSSCVIRIQVDTC